MKWGIMISDADIYFGLILFILIPIVILHVGAILSYFKARLRKAVGAVMVVLGCVELSLWGALSFFIVLIYIFTVVVGIISLMLAYKVIKN
jgi:hypothetical protein